jgi:SM-20-related protein
MLANYLQLHNFFNSTQLGQLLKFVEDQESNFTQATTSTKARDYRESLVLYRFPEFSELVANRIRHMTPWVISEFCPETITFSIGEIECQLTAHNHNNFYKKHTDSGSPNTASRVLTYVYYFYNEPKSFSGGELVLYDSKVEDNHYKQADTFKKIEPMNNSIVFFLSNNYHEVLPVTCTSLAFRDSRFTINGWVRRQE